MGNPPIWDKSTYQFLYGCAKKLTADHPELQQEIPDVLSRVYLKFCKKQNELQSHPNPRGWMVETMKWILAEEKRRLNTEKRHLSHSIDSETDARKIEHVHARCSEAGAQKQQYTEDQMVRIQAILSPKDFRFLLAYYAPHSDRKALARREGMSYDGLRQRARRLVAKIRRRLR